MYCPKCGVKNPENGKFCRKCGTGLKVISDVMSGKLTAGDQHNEKKKKKETTWADALTLLAVSVAFFSISIFLAFQPMGAYWWFWMLIPAFTTLAQGVGKVIEVKQNTKNAAATDSYKNDSLPKSKTANELPPKQTEFVIDFPDTKHRTGDLAPPSVIDQTTRKLEMNSEGKTMDLPKKDK